MTEMEDSLRSCTEQLLRVREERERFIIEADHKISLEQKKVWSLQQKLEDANKRFAKVSTENYNLRNTLNSKDKAIIELSESESLLNQKLTDATVRLEFTNKQCASLQYEVRMLQKELEIRNKEREYDLKSIDAAQKHQQESSKKIIALKAECHRLRTMVQKRLPGPAALAKMKDEVERRAGSCVENGRRKPRTPAQPSPLVVTPRQPVSEGYLVKMQELDDENRHLRQLLAKKENDLQFVQLQYADEASKLSVVQRQHKELAGSHEGDEDNRPEPWENNSLVPKGEHFRVGKQHASHSRGRRIAGSDMQLLVDLSEIEKLEMTSRPSSAPHQCVPDASDTDSKIALTETVCQARILEDGLSDNYPEWIQDVLELIIKKHQVLKININIILDEIRSALSEISDKGNGTANLTYDQAVIDSMVATLVERVSCMIERSTGNNVVSFQSFLHAKSELTCHLEHLIHVCSAVLDGKANLQKFINEVCLTLEWTVNQYLYCVDEIGPVDCITNDFDGNISVRSLKMQEKQLTKNVKSKVVVGSQQEVQIPVDLMENHSQVHGHKFQEKQSVYYGESATADGTLEEEGKQITSSAISAAAEKLAECQETITSLSKKLQALKRPANADRVDKEKSYMHLLVANLPCEEDPKKDNFTSPLPEEVACKKEHNGPIATEKLPVGTGHKAESNGSTQVVLRPVIPKSPLTTVSVDMKKRKKKKQSGNLLSRLIFRKKA
ncbi:filament-like plant protein 7 [Oryza brachyantha]|uniref:Filament-like plant protein 7 n=1 Tax=Oryza brachyantha TaxID=4533 RepID=J3LZD4_ORYBR|nr:filament-like plant protein 7 [Oryza brachyantha]